MFLIRSTSFDPHASPHQLHEVGSIRRDRIITKLYVPQ